MPSLLATDSMASKAGTYDASIMVSNNRDALVEGSSP